MLKLTLRQQQIFQALTPCQRLADVGCDHGFIGGMALMSGVAKKVLFCDISKPSLEKAMKLCQKLEKVSNDISLRAEFFCQDGLQDLECDSAVIAGMGGLEIAKILQQAKKLPNTLILQPMRNQIDLRRLLCHNYTIKTDVKFFDKKYYDLIVAEKSQPSSLTELQLMFGKTNLLKPTAAFLNYIDVEIRKCKKILEVHPNAEMQHRLKCLIEVKGDT